MVKATLATSTSNVQAARRADVLRHIEYLSCVAGGSIVGAHYHPEVCKLFASKQDCKITRQDYFDALAGPRRLPRRRATKHSHTHRRGGLPIAR